MLTRTGRPLRDLPLVDALDVTEDWLYDTYARLGLFQEANEARAQLRLPRPLRTNPDDTTTPPSWWTG